jgi:hypothetical protein
MAQVLDAPVPAQGPPATGGGEQLHYSISDAAALLGVSRTTLWRRIRDGQLRV